MKKLYCLLFLCLSCTVYAQKDFKDLGVLLKLSSKYSLFPDSLRNIEPRIYQNKTYAANEHYNDSSLLIFIPTKFNASKPYEIVFWFHGWNNTIDSTIQSFNLIEQFANAHKNALLVFVESAKNAPDSYAGKFEYPNNFNLYVQDIITQLQHKKIAISNKPTSFIIAGHSGAYRALSYITLYSKYAIKAIVLFDALYGEEEKFSMYLRNNTNCKFLNIYTTSGGTLENSKSLYSTMVAWQWNAQSTSEETSFSRQKPYIFVKSSKNHTTVLELFYEAYLWASSL